jgi:hypothetical protein
MIGILNNTVMSNINCKNTTSRKRNFDFPTISNIVTATVFSNGVKEM